MNILLVGFFLQVYTNSKYSSTKTKPVIGNVKTFTSAYERWEVAKQGGTDRNLVISPGYSKGLSFKFTNAHGIAKIDLTNGSISVKVLGLPENETFEIWLVDNKSGPKDCVKPEPWDTIIRVGNLKHKRKKLRLEAGLDGEALKNFKIELVFVAQDNKDPGEAGPLFGSPSLFQRLYHNEHRGHVAKLGLVHHRNRIFKSN